MLFQDLFEAGCIQFDKIHQFHDFDVVLSIPLTEERESLLVLTSQGGLGIDGERLRDALELSLHGAKESVYLDSFDMEALEEATFHSPKGHPMRLSPLLARHERCAG